MSQRLTIVVREGDDVSGEERKRAVPCSAETWGRLQTHDRELRLEARHDRREAVVEVLVDEHDPQLRIRLRDERLEQPLEDFDPAHCCDHEINLRRLFHRKPIL